MKAISEQYDLETILELMINAGVDIFCFGNNLIYDPNIVKKVHVIIKRLFDENKISENNLNMPICKEVFNVLGLIRVYSKSPRDILEEVDKGNPVVLKDGSTVEDAALKLHKELAGGFKYAVLWGSSGKFQGQRVGKQHILSDEDILEIHT